MKILPGEEAYGNLKTGIRERTFRVPTKDEPQFWNGMFLPKLSPRFSLKPNEKIFTIGSCFAREIERLLIENKFNIPIKKFELPSGEFQWDAASLLNEYNAGTIFQRIESVFDEFEYTDNIGIEQTKEGYVDLFLHIHNKPISLERLIQRRTQINELYKELLDSTTIIITLGLTECWYDVIGKCYLNKAPSRSLISLNPGRYEFHRMDVGDVLDRMCKTIELINKHSIKNILLTVSPVPLEATFTTNNAIMANSYSKSVLRIVAEKLMEMYDNVDYFPSYEIALSGGLGNFQNDNIHVEHHLVKTITEHMISNYYLKRFEDNNTRFQKNYVDEEYNQE